jgi:antitoxin YefM
MNPGTEGPMDAASLTEARDRLSEIVERVATTGDVFTITRHGRPMAVVLGYDEYESLIETLNVLADTDTMTAIEEARAETHYHAETD